MGAAIETTFWPRLMANYLRVCHRDHLIHLGGASILRCETVTAGATAHLRNHTVHIQRELVASNPGLLIHNCMVLRMLRILECDLRGITLMYISFVATELKWCLIVRRRRICGVYTQLQPFLRLNQPCIGTTPLHQLMVAALLQNTTAAKYTNLVCMSNRG